MYTRVGIEADDGFFLWSGDFYYFLTQLGLDARLVASFCPSL